MSKLMLVGACCILGMALRVSADEPPKEDVIHTPDGDLRIRFVGHASLVFSYGGKVVHVDPVGAQGDYSRLPKADLVLVTHEHHDHLDPDALAKIRTSGTAVVLTEAAARTVTGGVVMRNDETKTAAGFRVEAVPAYNIAHKRPDGTPFHPRGIGNGYVISFGNTRVYIAGDTENIPEMKNLKNIAIAFLPMNLPYTMTPEMTAAAAHSFHPRVLYPYHFGETDTSRLVALLAGCGIEVRIRAMK